MLNIYILSILIFFKRAIFQQMILTNFYICLPKKFCKDFFRQFLAYNSLPPEEIPIKFSKKKTNSGLHDFVE